MGYGYGYRLEPVLFGVSTYCQSYHVLVFASSNLIEILRVHRIVDPSTKRDQDYVTGPAEQRITRVPTASPTAGSKRLGLISIVLQLVVITNWIEPFPFEIEPSRFKPDQHISVGEQFNGCPDFVFIEALVKVHFPRSKISGTST